MNIDRHLAEVMTAYDVVAAIFDDAFRNEQETEAHAKWLLELTECLGVQIVLDAGTGTGEQAIRLWKSGRFKSILANDQNNTMLSKLRAKLITLNVQFKEGNINSIPLPSFGVTCHDWPILDQGLPKGTLDLIFCLGHSFYHLLTSERFLAALSCWNRLLVPGGYILIDMNAGQAETAKLIRADSFEVSPWHWNTKELIGRSGKLYLKTSAKATLPLQATPLGYWEQVMYIIAELTQDRHIERVSHLTTGGAILDKTVISDMAAKTGFNAEDLPLGSPTLHTPSVDILLRKQ